MASKLFILLGSDDVMLVKRCVSFCLKIPEVDIQQIWKYGDELQVTIQTGERKYEILAKVRLMCHKQTRPTIDHRDRSISFRWDGKHFLEWMTEMLRGHNCITYTVVEGASFSFYSIVNKEPFDFEGEGYNG